MSSPAAGLVDGPKVVAGIQREQTLNTPNTVTMLRLLLAVVVFAMMQLTTVWWLTALLFLIAVCTDVVDGYIARKYQLITTFGRVMDPFVDKFITSGVFVFLLATPGNTGLSPWIVMIVLGREMLVTSLRGWLEQAGYDFSASAAGKLKMFLQCAAATLALLMLDPLWTGHPWLEPLRTLRDVLLWGMTIVTVWSGYVYVQRAIELVTQASPANPSGDTATDKISPPSPVSQEPAHGTPELR